MRRMAFSLTLALVFTIPWEDSVQVSGVGTISRAVGLLAAVLWLAQILGTGRLRPPDRFHAAVLLLVVWNGLTMFWSLNPVATITGFSTYVQLFVLLLMMWELFTTQRAVELALQAYVLGGFVSVALILLNYLDDKPSYYLRYGPPGADVDGAALILALGMPAALHLAADRTSELSRHAVLRVVNFAYVPAAVFGIVLTGTRGAVVASIPTLVYSVVVLMRGGPLRRALGAAAVVVAVLLTVQYAPTASLDRIESASSELSSSGDLNGRVEIWNESLAAFVRRPVGGVGHDAHRAAISIGKVAHNTPLSILVETGVVGAVLFLGVAASTIHWLRRVPRGSSWYWWTQLAVVFLGSLSLSVEDRKAIWFFIGACVASGSASVAARTETAFVRTPLGVHARPRPAPLRQLN